MGTYRRETNAYLRFCRDVLKADAYGDDGCPTHLLAHCYAWHLIQAEYAVSTVRSKLSAIVDHLVEQHVIVSRHAFYSPALARLLRGWHRLQSVTLGNERTRCKIELSSGIYASLRTIAITERAKNSPDSVVIAAAALAVGMTLHGGFRPSEIMNPYGTATARCYMRAGTTHWLLPDGTYVCVTNTRKLPPTTRPTALVTLLPTKADQTGRNGPRAIAANPDTSATSFCMVTELFAFLRVHTPSNPSEGIFAGATSHKTKLLSTVRELYRLTAIANGLDPRRLIPHSGRVGHVAMLVTGGFDSLTICMSGGWRSADGIKPYMRAAVDLSIRTARALYDVNGIRLCDIKHMYNTADIRG